MTADVAKFSPGGASTQVADICPLCQQVNLCAVTTDTPIKDCWCQSQSFPPKTQLAVSLQAKLIVNTCICQSCLDVFTSQ
ncbi:cysteine-rich CWC family protein [Shewanella sp.]|uniref:cysteine-rich CWC family protein n=1 Tax=Shewanella sp. TaxID=50422 RepID=UPI0040543FD4